ncbi:hypothetical protein R6Q57_029890 [Mikania cordata]
MIFTAFKQLSCLYGAVACVNDSGVDMRHPPNMGFAFVNFTSPEVALRFLEAFHRKHWNFLGKTTLINNFKCMNFNHGYEEEDMLMCLAPPKDGSCMAAFKNFAVAK